MLITLFENKTESVAKKMGVSNKNGFDKKHKHIAKKIEDEKNKYTGLIDKKKEEKLNEFGVLDEEIEALGKEELEMIMTTPEDELEVYTSVYACLDAEEEVLNESASSMIELSEEQIDKMYAKEYYGESNDLETEIRDILLKESEEDSINENEQSENLKPVAEGVDRGITKSSYMEASMINESVSTGPMINVGRATTTALSSTTSSYYHSAQTSYLKKHYMLKVIKRVNKSR